MEVRTYQHFKEYATDRSLPRAIDDNPIVQVTGASLTRTIDYIKDKIESFALAVSVHSKLRSPSFYYNSDIRYHVAVALHAAREEKSLSDNKAEAKEREHALFELQLENSIVWRAAQAHPSSSYVKRLGLGGPTNPFETQPQHLLYPDYEGIILGGLVSLLSQIVFQYLSLTVPPEILSSDVESIPLNALQQWPTLKRLMSIGPNAESVIQEVVSVLLHVWRLGASDVCDTRFAEIVSYICYDTTYEGFAKWVALLKVKSGGSSRLPILQAMALALTCTALTSQPNMGSAYCSEKFSLLLEQDMVPWDRPLLFSVNKGGRLNFSRTSVEEKGWAGSSSAVPYKDSFTCYLANQRGSTAAFEHIRTLLDRGAPIPYPDGAATESSKVASFTALLRGWEEKQQMDLFHIFARRKIPLICIAVEHQAAYVKVIFEQIARASESTGGEEGLLTFYSLSLAPILDLHKANSAMSFDTRWELILQLFRLGPAVNPLLESLFSHHGIPRMTDYRAAEVDESLRASSGHSSVRSFATIVNEFGNHVKDQKSRQLWIQSDKGGDFVLSLLLWGLDASSSELHSIVTFLTDINHNITWTTNVSGGRGGERKKDGRRLTYGSSILHYWFRVQEEAKVTSVYWSDHVKVIQHIISMHDVPLPHPSSGTGSEETNETRDWNHILTAFASIGQPNLWKILYERAEPFARFTDKAGYEGVYKKHCIQRAAKENDWKRLSEIGVMPDDKTIWEIDTSGTEDKPIKTTYWAAIRPTAGKEWFHKMLGMIRAAKTPREYEKFKASLESEVLQAVQDWETMQKPTARRQQ